MPEESQKHAWVALIYVPIQVEPKDDGGIDVFTGEDAEEIARDGALLVCWFCDQQLNAENYDTDCVGVEASATQSR